MIRDVSTLAVNHCDPAKRKALVAELLAFRERYGQEDMPEPLQQDRPKWMEYLSEEDQDRLLRIFERGVYAYEQKTGYTPLGEPARPNRTPPEDEPVTFRIDGGDWTEWARYCTDDEARAIRHIMEHATERTKRRKG